MKNDAGEMSMSDGLVRALPKASSEKEKSVINNHVIHNATRFAVSVNEDQERLPTFYWLPKLHNKPYKARFIANSSSCTTTELSKLLTS